MAQRPAFDTPRDDEPPAGAGADQALPRPFAELRSERSRFSRLLARFGLGELTDPLLRPTRHSAAEDLSG